VPRRAGERRPTRMRGRNGDVGRTNYSIRAVHRVCEILDLLQQAPRGAALLDVARATRLPKSSAFRYLATLERRRYVERDPVTGSYRAGSAFLPLRAHEPELLARRARPHMERHRDRQGDRRQPPRPAGASDPRGGGHAPADPAHPHRSGRLPGGDGRHARARLRPRRRRARDRRPLRGRPGHRQQPAGRHQLQRSGQPLPARPGRRDRRRPVGGRLRGRRRASRALPVSEIRGRSGNRGAGISLLMRDAMILIRAGMRPRCRGDNRSSRRGGCAVPGEEGLQTAGTSRREQILASALELFRKQGYDRTSLREISERLGISKSGLYHHFEAKDDLISSLVSPLLDRIHEIAATPPVGTDEDLRAFLATYIDTFIENREVLSLLANDVGVRNHSRVSQRLARVNDEIYHHITGVEPELGATVRAAQVLIGLQGAIIRYAAADPEVVRDVCLRTALAALSTSNRSNP